MSTKVDSISGKCKVNISVDCPCKLFLQGREYDAVPGDLFTLEQQDLSSPAAFFIGIKDVSSVLSRVISLRRELVGRLEFVQKQSFSSRYSDGYVRGFISSRVSSLSQFASMLDAIIKDYSL